MERDQMSAAVGVGFSTRATAETIARAVRLALDRTQKQKTEATLHSSARKRDSQPLRQAAEDLNMPLAFHEETDLQRQEPNLLSPSPLVKAITGVGGIAEAAALAGAGGNARLIVAKFSLDGVCCAVAISPEF
jgi:cobalt-precorrin 5A hydrolase